MKLIADSNGARNRGNLLYVYNSISYINLNDISQKSPEIDSAWAVIIINNNKYIIGLNSCYNIYICEPWVQRVQY